MADLVKVTIDGREELVPKNALIIDAARQAGVDIAVFCYHEKLKPAGACRACLVEIEKVPRLQTACTTPVTDGMVVHTDTPAVDKARKGVLEFLLTNHPLDCPVCDKGGECPLQDTTFKYACDRSRFSEEKRHFQKSVRLSERIVLDRERCIMCMRCVRFQREVAGDEALTIVNRGSKSMIGVLPGRTFDSPFSGNTTELCPVGALTSELFRFKARSWELKKTPSVCALCPVGCNLNVETRDGKVLRLTARENPAVDDGWLCDWGRFSFQAVSDPARLTSPMVRKNGQLVPATWEEALETVARGMSAAAAQGGQAVGGLISPHATNEELYLFRKLFCEVLKSDNVDHGLHGGYSPPESGLDAATGSLAGLESASVIVLAGADPLAHQPVLDLRVKKAVRKGARLVAISDRPTDLTRLSQVDLRVTTGGEAAVIAGLIRLLLSEGFLGQAARDRLGTREARVAAGAEPFDPETVQALAGVEPSRLEDAAKLLADATSVAVLFPRPVPGEPMGLRESCERLAAVVGSTGDSSGGLFPLSRATNAQGALDIGIFPDRGVGLNGAQMVEGLRAGTVKALFVAGLDPATGASDEVRAALAGAPFLVVQDLYLTATAWLAHVVLPGVTFAEKDGTLTNLERRVQRLVAAVPPAGKAMPDWQVISAVANALGAGWTYESAAEVFSEIASTVAEYRGLSYGTLGLQGQRWQYPGIVETRESGNGRERRLWYTPLQPIGSGA